MFRKIVTYLTVYSFLYSNVCFAAMITPDGRTATSVNVSGNTYDVTTSTVSGKNAFNSFSNFDVYKGTTVNLHLPTATLNLINLVRDKKTNIDGILNSIKNGKIGGNVFILNPHGVAIGKSGVVNVGSLMLSTPNWEFMEQVIAEDGSISELATKSVLAGDLPINPAGVISVKGKINALDAVAVKAGKVTNTGEILANLKPTVASDIVNTGGIDVDAPLVFKDGKIGIFAEGDVTNAGTIRADANAAAAAGDIVVKAKGDINLQQGSLISSSGSAENKAGGKVIVFADNRANLEQGAKITADAHDDDAEGGFVELSALKEVNLNGGTMSAGGAGGMIFIDPETLNITSDSAYAGKDDIYAIANVINVKEGVSLIKEKGDITLIARDTDAGWVKKSSAFLNIEDNAVLDANNIYLYALAGDAEVLEGIVTGETTVDNGSSALTAIEETLKAKGLEFFETLTNVGLFVGYSKSEAEAGINIGKNVTINAAEDVLINSKVVSNSTVDTLGTGIDVTVAENSASSNIFIDRGTKISSAGDVTVSSDLVSNTSAVAETAAYGSGRGVPVDIAVAVGLADTENTVDIKNGTSITAGGDVKIAANTDKTHEVSASGLAYQDGWAAAGVAYSESASNNNVVVGGTIEGQNVDIVSDINVSKNSSSAKTVVGNGIFDRLKVWAGNKMLDGLSHWITAIPAQTHSQSNVKLALSGAVSYSSHDNTSTVKVMNNYADGQNASNTAVTSVKGDNVTISSHVLDIISNGASASVSPKTNKGDHSGDQNKENSFAGAVGYGVYDNSSRAEIGSGVVVNAAESLNLTSETEEPVVWPDASILDIFDGLTGNVLEKGEALLTNIDEYLTANPLNLYTSLVKSSANTSSGDAQSGEDKNGIVGIAGSVNLMKFNNKSDAVIADGAQINQLYNTTADQADGNDSSDKKPTVNVSATSFIETLNLSGEYGGAAQYGLGGSYLQTWFDSDVNALIGDNVKLYAGNLAVNADATHRNLSIAGTAGYKKTDTFGFQGSFDWLKSDSDVLAQIGNQADIVVRKANDDSGVLVNADSTNGFINIAGGVVRGSMVGIGASGALNDITQNTRAVIGSLDQNDTTAVTGSIKTDGNVTVSADNSSHLYAISAAGAVITQDKGQDNGKSNFGLGLSGTASYNTLAGVAEAYVNNAVIEGAAAVDATRPSLNVTAANDNDILTVGGGISFVKQGDTSVGMAGAVGINDLGGSRSVAFINNSRVDKIGSLTVNAASTGNIIAAAESAAGAFGKTGIAIAGSVSINEIGNLVQAYISNVNTVGSKFINADDVVITADNGGDIFSLAGNISAANTGGVGTAVAVNSIDNTTEAYAEKADIDATTGNIVITADNDSFIETSSAGVAYGQKAGVSGSVSVNNINNVTRSYADAADLTAYGSVLLKSLSDSTIDFYGGMIALSTQGVGGGGTVGVSSITEDTLAEIRNGSNVKAYGNKSAADDIIGVGVLAENNNEINMYGVNAGLGKMAGIGANVDVSSVNSSANARIDGSKINEDMTGADDDKYAAGQKVKVAAANLSRLETHAGTLGAGTVGVGLSSVTTLINNTALAEIAGASKVKSKSDIDVNADGKTYFNSVVVGGAGGKVGVAGNVNVAEIGNTSSAFISGSTVTGYGNTSVAAKDVTRLGKRLNDDGSEEDFAVALGAGGVGLYNGTGASVLVSNIANTTQAKIINSTVDTAGKLLLSADSDSSILSYVFAAGLGLYSGVAGSIAVNSIDNTTEALIVEDEGKSTAVNLGMSNGSQDVQIQATAAAEIENLLGSASAGLGTGGASVDVSTIDGRTTAGTMGGVTLLAGRDIDISADSERNISVEGIAGSGGGGALSGAISVVRVGSNYTDDMQEQTAGVLETVNQEISRNGEYQESLNIEGLPDDVDLTDYDRDVNKEFSTAAKNDVGTSAYIGSGATITAGGNVNVSAADKVNTHNLTGEIAAAGMSVGASVGITDIRNAAKAYIAGNTILTATGDLALNSLTDTVVDSKSMGGVVAASASIGGSVVHVDVDNASQAYIGNGARVTAGNLTVKAKDKADIDALAAGVAAGAIGAAGASVAIVNKANNVQAFAEDGATIRGDNFESSAEDEVDVNAEAIAGAAGAIGAEGTYAESSIISKLKSYVGDAVFNLAENFRMFTSGISHGNAEALGVNAGIASVGASIAQSDIDIDNQAVVESGAEIAAKDVYIAAGQQKADATADSLAAMGALIGGNGADTDTEVGGSVLAKVEDGVILTKARNVEVLSMSNSGQSATSSAYRGGLLAVGATLADAKGHLDTQTVVGALNLTADKLTAKAEATDILYAEAVSGSGGVISGAAAVANTENEAETRVVIGADGKEANFDLKSMEVLAKRTVKQNAAADSVNASVVGASGARADNVSTVVTTADIAGKTDIAVNEVDIKALNVYDKNKKFAYNDGSWTESDVDYNIQSGSGGVIDAPAVISKTEINNEAVVNFGKDTVFARNQLRLDDDGVGRFVVSALNDVKAVDKAKLVSGGALAIADTISSIDNKKNKAAVNLNGSITSVEDIMLTANSNADLSSEVYVNTYGASGVAMGSSTVKTAADNSVNFAAGSQTMSYGDLYVYAGQAYEDYSGNNTLHSRVYLWNNTALPFSDPEVVASIDMNNLINIDSGAMVKSGRDINLTANMGIAVADGFSSAKNPYNQLLSLEDKSFNGTVGNNSQIVVNGTVKAGVNNIQSFIVEENGRVKVTIGEDTFYDDDELYHKKTNEKLYSNLVDEINRMRSLRAEYIEDAEAVAYYDAEIAALEAKLTLMGLYGDSGLINTTVDYITLNDIYAQSGAINLDTASTSGSGQLSVTSDAAVTVENKSSAFLRVGDVTIPETDGGTVTLNGASVTSDLGSLQVEIAEKQMESPVINIVSTIPASDDGRAPNIDIDGVITNYGGEVSVNNASGSIYIDGNIRAGDLSISAGRDVYQGYTNGFRHIGGSPETAWNAISSANESNHLTDTSAEASSNADIDDSRSSLVADNNIFISGRYINLNGLVQSGTADYSLNIPNEDFELAGGLKASEALVDYNRNKTYNYNASPLYKLADKYGNINAYYNVETDQIELSDVRVEGGYVEIYGHILNTSKNSGEIMVTDGYGRINVNNQSGKAIVVNNMSLSNRISGVIKITDMAKTTAGGEYLQTTYTRNGNTITVADNAGGNRTVNAVQDANGKSSTTYSPLANQRYVWQTGQKTVSETTKTYEGDSFWGLDWLVPDTGENVTIEGPTPVGDPVKLEDGERIEIAASDNLYEYEKDSYISSENKLIYHNVEQWSEGWWIFSVDKYKTTDIYQQGETHINTHSVKADYDINISFKGYDSALTDIFSRSDITLNGVINNRSGTTDITTDGAIKVGSDYARIFSGGLNLTANNGIGSGGTALAVDIKDGNLNVVNNLSGDINLKAAGSDFVFNSINNKAGNTSVFANGSILGATADSLISGREIDLTAQTGSVGTADTALKIQTSGDDDSVLTALADQGIYLQQESGDLGLESVVSLSGDVNIKVDNGNVFDANSNEVYDNKTVEQLTKIWDDMGLDVGNEQMKQAFLNGKKAEYNAYWQYKSRQPEGEEPKFEFTAAEREALLNKELTESEKQALGTDKITDDYIDRLEAEKTAEYKELAAVYGDEAKYGSSYDADWSYQLSAAEEAELAEGAGWNESQLTYSIFKAREGEVVDTQYMIEDPNISGKNVTVEAGGSIGLDAGSETFRMSELSSETDTDKILLIASAERDNLEIAEDGDTVTVHKREDVDIHADGITLKAKDYIYLGGEEDINVNTVEAGSGKNITIAGAKGIYNVATDAEQDNIIGGNLVLEAAEGSIGSADKKLNIRLDDGAKLVARSQNDIYLNSTGGDLLVDSMLALKGTLDLSATGSLLAGTMAEGEIVNMQGQSIVLAAENIGDEQNYLTIALADDEDKEHGLTVKTTGDANIDNLGAQELAVRSADVGGTLRLKSASTVIGATADSLLTASAIELNEIAGNIGAADRYLNVAVDNLTASADGSIYINNNSSAVFNGVAAGQDVQITSVADLTVTDVVSGGNTSIDADAALTVERANVGGNLQLAATNDLTVNQAEAEGEASLLSRLGNILSSLITSGGKAELTAEKDVTATNIDAEEDVILLSQAGGISAEEVASGGKAELTAEGLAKVDNLQAGKTIEIAAGSADLNNIAATGNILATVVGDNIFGSFDSADGNISLFVKEDDANLRGSVKAANGQVTVAARDSIVNAGAPAEGAIIANTVDLTATTGSIGAADNYLTVDSSYNQPGWINAAANDGIYISEVNGDMNIRQFVSNGDIDMRVESSIKALPGMPSDIPNFKADNITLHTNGSIGEPDNRLTLALNDNGTGKINLKAEDGIAVDKLGAGLTSDYVYNFRSGKVLIDLPSGHAHIDRITAVGGLELLVRADTEYYNIWLSRNDLENRMINPPYGEYPSENPIDIMHAPLIERYLLPTDGLFMNIGSLDVDGEKLSADF